MNKFLVVDFETTGNRAKDGAQIIQVGAVLIERGEIVSRYSSLVNPGIPIPPFIQQLTQISDEMVREAPMMEEVIVDLLPLLDGAAFVAHNVHFDIGFLQAALTDAGYLPFAGPLIDTVELSRLLLPGQPGYKLSELSSDLEVEHDAPHQADSDAQATAEIFLNLVQKLNELPLLVVQRLAEMSKNFSSDISMLIQSIEQERIQTGRHGDEDERLEMYRQIALTRKGNDDNDEQQRIVSSDVDFPSFLSELYETFEEQMPGFESRPGQRAMMRQIYDAFSESRHLLVEAGTGTGKSLAYLVPALYWAEQSGEKVVISTHTIQLQEQLYGRDLPLLAEMLSIPVKAAIFKGRNNYLCLRKFEMSLADDTDNYEIQLSKGQILTWLTETETGDVEEINLPSGGRLYWRQTQSDANSCLNNQCPWFSRCFYYSARRQAMEADVIITNHSLLLTDLQAEQRILPPYRYAIIDEAHQFEEVASNHLGLRFSSIEMERVLDGVTSDRESGLLDRMTVECASLDVWEEIGSEVEASLQMTVELKEYAKDLFNQLFAWGRRSGKESAEAGRLVKRYEPGEWFDRAELTRSITYTQDWIRLLHTSLQKIYVRLHDDSDANYSLRSLAIDLRGLLKDIGNLDEAMERLMVEPEAAHVYWMELDTRATHRNVFLHMAPVDIAPLLRKQFFAEKESVALTSATLSVNQSFDYALERLGLDPDEVDSVHHGSPFNFKEQTLLCVPNDIPTLNRGEEKAFIERLSQSLNELAKATSGRMLVLFTSYQMLRQVHERLKQSLRDDGFTVLGHGIDSNSRSKLTKQFIHTPKSVLLGASSFWEGVDIPGEALSCLAIVRLPFSPPNHPIVEARNEQIKQRNGNPFMELSVPQAVIRFKQGFGRLVRTQRDKGVVIVFDKRLVAARYGKYFARSLPPTPLHHRPMDELLPMIKDWLK